MGPRPKKTRSQGCAHILLNRVRRLLFTTPGQDQESARGDHKDHWYIGGDDPDIENDSSECLGSTGVRPNLHLLFKCGDGFSNAQCQQLQISFSSNHRGIVNVAMMDGLL